MLTILTPPRLPSKVLLTGLEPIIRRNANATVQCPVQEGNYVIKHTASLPKEIPLGMPTKYTCQHDPDS